MNRRSFLAGLIAAPIVAACVPAKVEACEVLMWRQDSLTGPFYCETPNGEPITAIREMGGRVYVFTRSIVYEVRKPVYLKSFGPNEPRLA